jgi:hypothetical protein
VARVMIGTDPHKRSATIEVRDEREILLATGRFGMDKTGYRQLLGYVRQWPTRTWAVEGANGVGLPGRGVAADQAGAGTPCPAGEYYPGFLAAFAAGAGVRGGLSTTRLASREARAVLAIAPSPTDGLSVSKARVETALRHLFDRMLGQLHHCLLTRQTYDTAKAFGHAPVNQTTGAAPAAA